MEIKKATKVKQKLRLAISGASGSGKTYSALLLARELGSKICVIDTEQGSASLYADLFDFDVLELVAPYSSERYIEAIKRVEIAGYEVIVIDSLSHNWNQAGGCLDKVNSIGGNSYTAWGKVTPQHDKLIHAMLASPAHIIATMRSKTAYELIENEKGKLAPVKRGLAPIQRDGVEYEFTVMFDLDQNHNFVCTKDRTNNFLNSDIPEPLTPEVAQKLKSWLNSGQEVKIKPETQAHEGLYSEPHPLSYASSEEEPKENRFDFWVEKLTQEAFTLTALKLWWADIGREAKQGLLNEQNLTDLTILKNSIKENLEQQETKGNIQL